MIINPIKKRREEKRLTQVELALVKKDMNILIEFQET